VNEFVALNAVRFVMIKNLRETSLSIHRPIIA